MIHATVTNIPIKKERVGSPSIRDCTVYPDVNVVQALLVSFRPRLHGSEIGIPVVRS